MKMLSALIVFALVAIAPSLSFAADAASPAVAPASMAVVAPVAVASPAPAVVAPVPLEQKVQSLMDKIPGSLPIWLITLLGFLCEMIMRFWPTIQPRSMFILAGNLFGLVGSGFIKISKLLDSIVQNIKDPSKQA